jgi:hypothetical protein
VLATVLPLPLMILALGCGTSGDQPRGTTTDEQHPAPPPEVCTELVKELEALISTLETCGGEPPARVPSALDESLDTVLLGRPAEARRELLHSFGLNFPDCEAGKALGWEIEVAEEPWLLVRDELPKAVKDCGCYLNFDTLQGWVHTAAIYWKVWERPAAQPEATEPTTPQGDAPTPADAAETEPPGGAEATP